MQKSWYMVVTIVGLMLFTTSLVAAPPPTVTFNLTNVNTTGANLAGVYTSPYYGNVNSGATIPVICDDFADESFIPESWTAYSTSLSSVISGTWGTPDTYLKWTGGAGLNQAAAYTVAAVLAVDILNSTGTAQKDYSYAMWELFDYTDANNQLVSCGASCSADVTAAQQDLANAVSFVNNSANANQVHADVNAATIYTYVPGTGTSCGGGYCPPPPQEFITVNAVAEPPSPVLLAADLLALAGLIFIARRRLSRSLI